MWQTRAPSKHRPHRVVCGAAWTPVKGRPNPDTQVKNTRCRPTGPAPEDVNRACHRIASTSQHPISIGHYVEPIPHVHGAAWNGCTVTGATRLLLCCDRAVTVLYLCWSTSHGACAGGMTLAKACEMAQNDVEVAVWTLMVAVRLPMPVSTTCSISPLAHTRIGLHAPVSTR